MNKSEMLRFFSGDTALWMEREWSHSKGRLSQGSLLDCVKRSLKKKAIQGWFYWIVVLEILFMFAYVAECMERGVIPGGQTAAVFLVVFVVTLILKWMILRYYYDDTPDYWIEPFCADTERLSTIIARFHPSHRPCFCLNKVSFDEAVSLAEDILLQLGTNVVRLQERDKSAPMEKDDTIAEKKRFREYYKVFEKFGLVSGEWSRFFPKPDDVG